VFVLDVVELDVSGHRIGRLVFDGKASGCQRPRPADRGPCVGRDRAAPFYWKL
jgi:hypothetical protein